MKPKLCLLVLLLGIFIFSKGQIPTDGLVGYWPFNGNANDESGKGNHGTVYGATLTTDRFGSPNKVYDFDGIVIFESNVDGPLLNIDVSDSDKTGLYFIQIVDIRKIILLFN